MSTKETPMAKKTKKPATKKKAPRKASARKSPSKASASPSRGSFKISTGSGASPMELGQQLVALFNQGKADAWVRKVWSPKIESIEGVGMNMGWRGVKAVDAKNNGWMKTHIVHGASAEGPYVGSTGFSVRLAMDVEDTTTGQRMKMQEVGVYTVSKGKIVREEFMYYCGG
jgi:hypothetical protein